MLFTDLSYGAGSATCANLSRTATQCVNMKSVLFISAPSKHRMFLGHPELRLQTEPIDVRKGDRNLARWRDILKKGGIYGVT